MLARSSGIAWHRAEIPPIPCNIHSVLLSTAHTRHRQKKSVAIIDRLSKKVRVSTRPTKKKQKINAASVDRTQCLQNTFAWMQEGQKLTSVWRSPR
jgi:hypothetical protein